MDFLTILIVEVKRRKEVQVNTTTITRKLAEFWMPNLLACEDFSSYLQFVNQSIKDIKPDAVRRNLEEFDDRLKNQVPKDWRLKEYRSRTVITLAGKVKYLRRIYIEPSGICHAYLDEVLGISSRKRIAPDAFIWIALTAADISFRKTADRFCELTGAKISPWTVMNIVHTEGALILEEMLSCALDALSSVDSGDLISQDVLYIEFDGIYIPLQKIHHEPRKPRWRYEHDRHKQSFELKSACVYAGKNDKGQRGGLIHFVSDKTPKYFWPLLSATIGTKYLLDDVEKVFTSSDMAAWCKSHSLDDYFSYADITHHLDAYHVNREIAKTFGFESQSKYFRGLIYKGRKKRLFKDLSRVIAHATPKDKDKYIHLLNYLKSNQAFLSKGLKPSMGTMEGTNAHVYAARMKVWGGAWSRRGALAMALIRARLASGFELIAPKYDEAMYSDAQIRKRHLWELKQHRFACFIPESSGHGYAPQEYAKLNCLGIHMKPWLYGILRN
ncbi:hypothetical protein FACS1894104_5670 [Actinomycetota bacterium]|nr:hypothetical protein FACS1894104_5670 [Actinomycetota bacterium]